jgi:hypothetical protein
VQACERGGGYMWDLWPVVRALIDMLAHAVQRHLRAHVQACEWVGGCKGCGQPCVLNKDLATVEGGEAVGSTLVDTPTYLAAVMCPALTLALRYGAKVPDAVDLVRASSHLALSMCPALTLVLRRGADIPVAVDLLRH